MRKKKKPTYDPYNSTYNYQTAHLSELCSLIRPPRPSGQNKAPIIRGKKVC
jgi:hypothetical protein